MSEEEKQDSKPQEAAEEPKKMEDKPQAPEDASKYYDQILRLRAEFDNYRKRTEKERGELLKWSEGKLLAELLPIYDALETACQGLDQPHTNGEVAQGLKLVFQEMKKVLESKNVKPIEALEKPYNPESHEIVGVVPREDVDDDIVVQEVQKGFEIDGRIIRSAKVLISKKSG